MQQDVGGPSTILNIAVGWAENLARIRSSRRVISTLGGLRQPAEPARVHIVYS